ncbi:MAG: glycosyltransferase [Sphingobacteriaceae bacterium]
MNNFIFLIPLTPQSHMTENRIALRTLCLNNLVDQTYANWKAILIGEKDKTVPHSDKFILLNIEGQKEEKLQNATKYILDNHIAGDYIIRLDDDDLFNPNLLEELKDKNFDICIDKYHTFWDASTGQIAQQVPMWFANTCIHKRTHALTVFGKFPRDTKVFTKSNPYLIENGHGDFHKYYNEDHIILIRKRFDPVYVRTLNPDSHSSNFTGDFVRYMNLFGIWRSNCLPSYQFIDKFKLPYIPVVKRLKQDWWFYIKNTYAMFKGLINFKSKVIIKN